MEWGDQVIVKFEPRLRLEYTPDQADIASLAFGPYILAAVSDRKEYFELPISGRILLKSLSEWPAPIVLSTRISSLNLHRWPS